MGARDNEASSNGNHTLNVKYRNLQKQKKREVKLGTGFQFQQNDLNSKKRTSKLLKIASERKE
jgi:hypothetical protein